MLEKICSLITGFFKNKFQKNNEFGPTGSSDEDTNSMAYLERELSKLQQISNNNQRGAFIDGNGISWDVKTIKTHSIFSAPIFNKRNIEFTLKNELTKLNKNFIINISHLPEQELDELYTVLKLLSKEELKRIIVVHADNPEKSKSSQELVKFLLKE